MKRSILLSACILLVIFLVSCNLFGPDAFKVMFECNGGSAVAGQKAVKGSLLVEPKDPVKANYVFAGWFIDSEFSLQWNFSSDKVAKELTLHAKWDLDGYTVSYFSHGGTAVPSENVDYDTHVTEPADPTKNGYDFDGWYTDDTYATAWDFVNDTVDGNLVLHAKWTVKSYTVTFDSDGGTAVQPVDTDFGTAITKPTDPTLTGYTFGGWYRTQDFSSVWDFPSHTVQSDITLYAKWNVIGYTVAYDSHNGTAVPYENVEHGLQVTEPADPTKNGYDFVGWYSDATYATAWDFDNDTVDGNLILHAKWTLKSYTVTFDSDGGSPVQALDADFDTTITKPTDPTLTGHTFGGWYRNQAFTSVWDFPSHTVQSNITLYAKWNVISYTVAYESHGGTAVPSENVDYDTLVTEPADPTKNGFNFAGWYTDDTYATAWIFDNDTVDGNLILHAKWTVSGYSGARLTTYVPVSTTDFAAWEEDYESPATLLEEEDGLESIFVGAGMKSVELFIQTVQTIMSTSNPTITPRSLEIDLGIFLRDEGFNITDNDTSESLGVFVNHFDLVANGSTTNFVKTILHFFDIQQVPDYLMGSRIGVSGDMELALGDVNYKMALFADASINQITLSDQDGLVDVKFALSVGTDRAIGIDGNPHNFPIVIRFEIDPVVGVQFSDINTAINELTSQEPTESTWADFCEAIWGTGTDHMRLDLLFGDAQGNVDNLTSQSFAGYEVIQFVLDIMNFLSK